MPAKRSKSWVVSSLKNALNAYSARQRGMETMIEYEPTRYLVAGSHVQANSSVGDFGIKVSTYPKWSAVSGARLYIVIDAGTIEAEVRKVTTVNGEQVDFSEPLQYAHVEGDPILYVEGAYINIKWFGAIGDNSFDNKTTIQRAVNQATVIGGGTISIPAGQYVVSDKITLASNIAIAGESEPQSTINRTNTGDLLYANNASNIQISNLELKILGVGGAVHGIDVTGLRIDDLSIRENGAADRTGVRLTSCSDIRISGSRVYGSTDAIWIDSCSNITIADNYFDGPASYGCYLNDCGYATIKGNFSYSAGAYGFYIYASNDIIVVGNVTVEDGNIGIFNYRSDRVVIVANTVNAAANQSYYAREGSETVISGNVEGANYYQTEYGILVYDFDKGVVGGNVVGSPYTFDIKDIRDATADLSGTELNSHIRRAYRYCEYLSAKSFVQCANTRSDSVNSSLTKLGTSPYNPVAWKMAAGSTSEYVVYWGVWWAIPANFSGSNIRIGLTVYYSIYDPDGQTTYNLEGEISEMGEGWIVTGTGPGYLVLAATSSPTLTPSQSDLLYYYFLSNGAPEILRIVVGFNANPNVGYSTGEINLLGVEVKVY